MGCRTWGTDGDVVQGVGLGCGWDWGAGACERHRAKDENVGGRCGDQSRFLGCFWAVWVLPQGHFVVSGQFFGALERFLWWGFGKGVSGCSGTSFWDILKNFGQCFKKTFDGVSGCTKVAFGDVLGHFRGFFGGSGGLEHFRVTFWSFGTFWVILGCFRRTF